MENPPSLANSDDIYLKIWDIEQRHTTTRWTIATFFFSISFAIFGFSLQVQKPVVPLIVSQLTAVAVYWFGYLLFRRFHDFTHFLRGYLTDMETAKQTGLQLQTKVHTFMKGKKRPSSSALLRYFGILYTFAAIAIGIFL